MQKPFVNSHNLTYLLKLCIENDKEFKQLENILILNNYSVEIRYPDYFYIPDLKEAKQAYKLALETKDFIKKKINTLFSEV